MLLQRWVSAGELTYSGMSHNLFSGIPPSTSQGNWHSWTCSTPKIPSSLTSVLCRFFQIIIFLNKWNLCWDCSSQALTVWILTFVLLFLRQELLGNPRASTAAQIRLLYFLSVNLPAGCRQGTSFIQTTFQSQSFNCYLTVCNGWNTERDNNGIVPIKTTHVKLILEEFLFLARGG